jgi:hypothetical protein
MSHPVAYVLLERPVTLSETALVETLRQRHPEVRWDVAGLVPKARADDAIIIRCGDHLLVVMSMPAPLPYDENLWKRASRIWPEAPQAAERHKAHLIVSTMGHAENEPGHASPSTIEKARMTTAAAGGLIAMTTGCCAAVWDGGVARSARMWLNESRMAFSRYPEHPFALWVDVVPFPSGQTIGATTIGLRPFIHREIEFETDGLDRAKVIERVAGTAFYLIEHEFRGMIKNGIVLEGDSPADRVKVRARISRFSISPVLAIGPEHELNRPKPYPIIPLAIARNHPLLIMLGKAGLFDASGWENQIELWPHHYVSEIRMESYDQGLNGMLSKILVTDAYAAVDETARRALASGDVETAKSALMPFAKEVREFQDVARFALTNGDLHMFLPATRSS